MATTDHSTAEPADAVSAVTEAVLEADLVHLVAYADGDCVAATGLLAAACDAIGTPYHIGTVRTAAELRDRLDGADETTTRVVIGARDDGDVTLDPDGPVSPLAYESATAIGGDPAVETALAGVVAAGAVPSQSTPGLLADAALERMPGVAVPTTDIADGLAHSGLVHAAFSADVDEARAILADHGLADADVAALSEPDARRVASMVALEVGAATDATPRAATAVERALRPYQTEGAIPTLAGRADLLSALAEQAPGLAVTTAVTGEPPQAALDAWRAHGQAAHAAVRTAGTARHRGLLVARTDGPVVAVARLLRDFRSPEPVVVVVGTGQAAAASLEPPVTGPLDAAAEAAGGSAFARGTHGFATFDADRTERFIEAFREAAT